MDNKYQYFRHRKQGMIYRLDVNSNYLEYWNRLYLKWEISGMNHLNIVPMIESDSTYEKIESNEELFLEFI